MDNAEARSILAEKLSIYRQVPYADLATMVKSRAVHLESRGKSGTLYQVDISVYWDDEPAGDVRVLGAIDDGGWRPFFPLTDSFIKAPDNTFVDE
ncbi:MAG: hypothetical protein ACRETN_05530 [Nevskiales bacterium]